MDDTTEYWASSYEPMAHLPTWRWADYSDPAPRGPGPGPRSNPGFFTWITHEGWKDTVSPDPVSRDTGHGDVPPASREEGPYRCDGHGNGITSSWTVSGPGVVLVFASMRSAEDVCDVANAAYAAGRASGQGEAAIHYCSICGANWRLNKGAPSIYPPEHPFHKESWTLVSKSCGQCCDNAPMGEQIKPFQPTTPDLRCGLCGLAKKPCRTVSPDEQQAIADAEIVFCKCSDLRAALEECVMAMEWAASVLSTEGAAFKKIRAALTIARHELEGK